MQDLTPRLAARRREFDAARRRETLFGRSAAGVFVAGMVALLARPDHLFEPEAWWTVLAMVVALAPLVVLRMRWARRRARLQHATEWIEQALRRLDDDFDFGQTGGTQFLREDHPNAADLDLFGEASLYQRLNSCRTALGRDALAAWVAGSPAGATIGERREAIEELAGNLDLREALEVEVRSLEFRGSGDARDREALERSTRALLAWMSTPTPPRESGIVIALQLVAGAAASAAFVAWLTTDLGVAVLAPFYLLNGLVLVSARDVDELAARFERVRDTIEAWSAVLGIIENAEVHSPLLRQLKERLARDDARASAAMERLKRLVDHLSQRRNVFWRLSLDVLWLADLHLRRMLLDWKREHGADMAAWMDTAAQYEAMAALAAYRAGVPGHVLAEITSGDGPALEFEELAHPLLPAGVRVGNSLSLPQLGRLCLVTGSNMSGKSTFLRTAGIAVVMSRMGLPVPARSMRMRDMQVVTCMTVHDSLKDASSLFYAEVRRLRQCLDWAAAGDASLVLFDEILAGTNSRERHIGAVAILESLSRLPAVSLVSTHDLELGELAQKMPERLAVVHFRDHVRDGVMSFDYTLRPGVLPSTNALRVMRLAGLEVPEG